jgi:hypothetical protein
MKNIIKLATSEVMNYLQHHEKKVPHKEISLLSSLLVKLF